MTDTSYQHRLVELLDDMPIAMMTTFGTEGPRSLPMARQEVEPSAELWFITARDTAHVRPAGLRLVIARRTHCWVLT